MAGTTMVAYKKALLAALQAAPGLAGVQVTYADSGATARRERLFLGQVEPSEQEPVALRPARRRRDEEYVLKTYVEVIGSAKDPAANEERAAALALVLEEVVADSPKLGVPDVLFAVVSSQALETTETTDGPRSVLTTDITVRGRLL